MPRSKDQYKHALNMQSGIVHIVYRPPYAGIWQSPPGHATGEVNYNNEYVQPQAVTCFSCLTFMQKRGMYA